MSDLSSRVQERLSAEYAFERELPGGGMSRVFLMRDVKLERRVVVKVLPQELAEALLDRFRREILLAARLQHPNIVAVLSAGDVDGLPYLVMPFVDGESLRRKIERVGKLPVREAVPVMRDLARALAYAHEQG